jgi:bacterial/archaeal transporter family-2 protein
VSASGIAVVVSLIAGVAGGVQVAIAGAFGRKIGVLEATAFASVVGALVVVAATAVTRQGLSGVAQGFHVPAWMWLGGVMGAVVVTTISYAPPLIGTFATIGLLIAGQLAAGVLIDAFGLFSLERIPLNTARVAGLVLLTAGALLVLKR